MSFLFFALAFSILSVRNNGGKLRPFPRGMIFIISAVVKPWDIYWCIRMRSMGQVYL